VALLGRLQALGQERAAERGVVGAELGEAQVQALEPPAVELGVAAVRVELGRQRVELRGERARAVVDQGGLRDRLGLGRWRADLREHGVRGVQLAEAILA
jgi:hypothetical protein